MENGYPYVINFLIALDQALNALTGGSCDETMSSRIYRMARIKGGLWLHLKAGVNAVFFRDRGSLGEKHCQLAYLVEMRHGHMPKSMTRAEVVVAL